jgi:hypothetical protein
LRSPVPFHIPQAIQQVTDRGSSLSGEGKIASAHDKVNIKTDLGTALLILFDDGFTDVNGVYIGTSRISNLFS